jgi:hypothetical protein
MPNRKGSNILLARSEISCFQLLRWVANQTPMPDTKKRRGILQIFSMDNGTQRDSMDSSFWTKAINTPQG